jgi:hypothetical protein
MAHSEQVPLGGGLDRDASVETTTLQQAIKTRQDILNALPALLVSGVPNGAQLVSKLATAMPDSITADKDYQGWMAGF